MNSEVTKKVLSLMAKHPVGRPFFAVFIEREKSAAVTKVDTIENHFSRESVNYSRQNIVSFMKELGTTGAGHFVVGRRHQPSRFEWSVDPVRLAREIGDVAPPVPLVRGSADASHSRPAAARSTLNHTFNLRPDFVITWELPTDFSSVEAQRFSRFVESLPMELSAPLAASA